MLERVMNSDAIFWTMGVIAGAGIICKIITAFTLKRLVKAAAKMGKSNQKLMKLVKAKFEHAFMLSDRVDNVEAFVEKYLFEYRVLGLRIHTYRYFGKQSVWLLGFCGLLGMFLSYGQIGMEEQTFRYGAIGGTAMVLMLLIRISSDEEHQLEVVKTYMIDYLENVCAPRYSRQQSLKQQRMGNVMNETVIEPAEEVIVEAERETAAEKESDKAVRGEQNRNPEMKEIKIAGQESKKVELEHFETAKADLQGAEMLKTKTIETELQNMEEGWKKESSKQMAEEEKKIISPEIKSEEPSSKNQKEHILQEQKQVESLLTPKRELEIEHEQRIPQEVILREILEEFLA